MPSFPDSVFAPPNRSNGQTADASHMNGVQDEIVAIEGGYRNGTAPLNSSGSTVATLSVVSTASFASSVTFSSGVTFSTTVIMNRIQCVRLTNSTAQDIPTGAGTYTSPNWNTETYDNGGLHSTSVNSSRINLTSSGIWTIHGQASWTAASSAGFRLIRISLNDTTVLGQSIMMGATQTPAQNITVVYLATSTGDYVTLQGDQNSGSSDSFSATSPSWFAAERISN